MHSRDGQGARLPTEFEWEVASQTCAIAGNFMETEALHPRGLESEGYITKNGTRRWRTAADEQGLKQMFGDVWEWTASAYLPVSGISARCRRGGRVQRQVHVQPDGAARRIVRDAAVAHSANLSQFLSSPCALAVHGNTAGQWRLANNCSFWLTTRRLPRRARG